MRLALCQAAPTRGDVEGAFVRMDRMARAAALSGADLLLLPELYLPGYNRPGLHGPMAQPACGEWIARAAEIARQAGCALCFGFAEKTPEGTRNSAMVLSAEGERIALYRKVQPFGPMEEANFIPGEGYVAFDFKGRRLGLLICFDIEFPVHARRLAAAGVNLLLVPTANPAAYPHVQELLVPARAAENGITVAYANYTGDDAGLAFGGGSVIAGPRGDILARAGSGEALLVTDLPDPDPATAQHAPADRERGDIPGP